MPIIRLARFNLRPYRKGDEHSIVENINNPKISRATLTIPYPYTIADALSWIDQNLKAARKRKKTEINLAIDMGGQVIGGIGLSKMDGHQAEIGYWLAERYWGQGITTSAVEALSAYALNDLRLARVYAYVFSSNKASARVLEKAGYGFEGRSRRHVVKDGRRRDCLLFAVGSAPGD
ncbi:MAG: GNAT family N-acetyltransferase [Chloroflexi bacterium]|nr:GNAT family N-acetyltransferase [Chloroflexota bacterium]